MGRIMIGVACGVVLGLAGGAAWLVWFFNKDGGIFR